MIPKITPKEREVVLLIARFRFLNRQQVQDMLSHKDSGRINAWLKDLTEKKFLNRIYLKKLPENTFPAKYFLGINGIRYIRKTTDIQEEALTKYYRESLRSKLFIEKCILLGDLCLSIEKGFINKSGTADVPTSDVNFLTKIDLERSEFPLLHLPHAYVEIKARKTRTKRWVIEILGDDMPRYAMRSLVRVYINLLNEGGWQERMGPTLPEILFVCPTAQIRDYLCRFTTKTLEEEYAPKLVLVFSNKEDLRKHGVVNNDVWIQA